mgnify:CR=1 FL=1
MKLVDNARKLYKAWSVILPALSIIITAIVALLQWATTIDLLSAQQLIAVNVAINGLTIVARYIKQQSVSGFSW